MTIKDSAVRLLDCIGEIEDLFLDEALIADIAGDIAAKKRKAQYGTIAATASVGIVLTMWFIRSKRAAAAKIA